MKKVLQFAAWSFLLSFGACTSAPIEEGSPPENPVIETNSEIEVPEGFSISVFAQDLGRARHLVVRDNGDIYVALRSAEDGKGIVALRDEDGDGTADRIERFGDHVGTGIDIFQGYLYFGSDSAIYRYPLVDGELLPRDEPELIVNGFPEQGQHAVKPFAFDNEGNIYVNVGAPSNACQEQMRTPGSAGMDPCPQLERQAGVWRFDADHAGQSQTEDGHRYASGIRNSVAIAWNPVDEHVYVVQHGRDQFYQLWPDYYTVEESAILPAEEFFRLTDGADFGWPYCYYDQRQEKKVLAPEYGGDGELVGRCDQFDSTIVAFPGHWAPNDLIFYTGSTFPEQYRNGAFIAFHGSWNRAPLEQAGYLVAFVPFENGEPSGEWERFATGFPQTEEIKSPSDAQYRPMGLAQGPEGALYISDSQTGKIWKVTAN